MKIGDKIKYQIRKNSLEYFYGTILGFKVDKIYVSKYRYSDFSGELLPTYIDETDIIRK